MGLLQALGINGLAFVQFGILVAVFLFLTLYVFGPYLRAAEERQSRTKGGEVLADEFQNKAAGMQARYEERVRELNNQIAAIFQRNRSEAAAEQERIVGVAREEANQVVDKNRQVIGKVVASAAADLRKETPAVALAITNKLLGK